MICGEGAKQQWKKKGEKKSKRARERGSHEALDLASQVS